MEIKSLIEVSSDVMGAISAVALLVPAHNVVSAKATLANAKEVISNANVAENVKESLTAVVARAEEASNSFDPGDATYMKVGGWSLLASFVLKLVYHCLDKIK